MPQTSRLLSPRAGPLSGTDCRWPVRSNRINERNQWDELPEWISLKTAFARLPTNRSRGSQEDCCIYIACSAYSAWWTRFDCEIQNCSGFHWKIVVRARNSSSSESPYSSSSAKRLLFGFMPDYTWGGRTGSTKRPPMKIRKTISDLPSLVVNCTIQLHIIEKRFFRRTRSLSSQELSVRSRGRTLTMKVRWSNVTTLSKKTVVRDVVRSPALSSSQKITGTNGPSSSARSD